MTTTETPVDIAATADAPKKRSPRSNTALEGGELVITGLNPARKAIKRALALSDEKFTEKSAAALLRKVTAEAKVMRYNLEHLTFLKAAGIRSGAEDAALPPIRRRSSAAKRQAPAKAKKVKKAKKAAEEVPTAPPPLS